MKYLKKIIAAISAAVLVIPSSPFVPETFAQNRPGNERHSHYNGRKDPGNRTNRHRPGDNKHPDKHFDKPGGNKRPGNHNGYNRPHKPTHRPGYGKPTSAPKPGNSSYMPPRYPSRPLWDRPLPPRPKPPKGNIVYVTTRPSMSSILGLSFGSLINTGLATLTNAGYTIQGYADDAVYLNNVFQFGYKWPSVTIYYGNRGLCNARFQYSSPTPGNSRFNSVYARLCTTYGKPVSNTWENGVNTITWWGADNGYISLMHGPGLDRYGNTSYFTDIIFGN